MDWPFIDWVKQFAIRHRELVSRASQRVDEYEIVINGKRCFVYYIR
jgi:hypothetical protein